MKYKTNDPREWPIEGGKRMSSTAPSPAAAARQNAISNNAYKRAGYPEP
jgi:hypothetical protein